MTEEVVCWHPQVWEFVENLAEPFTLCNDWLAGPRAGSWNNYVGLDPHRGSLHVLELRQELLGEER